MAEARATLDSEWPHLLYVAGHSQHCPSMEYVTLPGTDLRVSRICLGTMQVSPCRALLRPCSLIGLRCGLQFAGSTEDSALNEEDITWGAIAQAEVNDAVEGALAAGVNFFDTAEVYPRPPNHAR